MPPFASFAEKRAGMHFNGVKLSNDIHKSINYFWHKNKVKEICNRINDRFSLRSFFPLQKEAYPVVFVIELSLLTSVTQNHGEFFFNF